MKTTWSGARWWIPIAGSLAVYLVPVVGPHASWFLGESLFQELTRSDDRSPWWLASNLALALTAQILVGLLLAWSLRGSRLRLLAWLPVAPALAAGLNLAYMVAIPSFFLIESDTAPAVTGLEEICRIPKASLMPLRTSVNQPAAGVRQWWLQRPGETYALLLVPDCLGANAGLPRPTLQPGGRVDFMLGFQFAAAGGAAVLEKVAPGTSERTWWLLTGPSAPLAPITLPEQVQGAPILSDTADALAWVQRVPGSPPPVLDRVSVRPLQPSPTLGNIDIELAPFGPASYQLGGVDTVAREVTLWRDDRPLIVGFDGQRRDAAFSPGAIGPQVTTYLRHRDGWVAWDASRDDGPYQIEWSLGAHTGTRRTNRGRGITSAAVDPSGQFIAVSESTALNIGDARDTVYMIRARDGVEAFRVYLPRYARSHVVFFEGGLFGYSDLEATHILRMPSR